MYKSFNFIFILIMDIFLLKGIKQKMQFWEHAQDKIFKILNHEPQVEKLGRTILRES